MYQLLDSHDRVSGRPVISSATARWEQRAWKWLAALDRTMVELASKGMSHRTIAGAVRVSPGTVTRRLGAIQDRIRTPLAQFLLDPACPVVDEARRAALLHEVTGLSTRDIAIELGIAHSLVLSHLSYARGLMRGLATRALTRA